jgi:hypothetical protein
MPAQLQETLDHQNEALPRQPSAVHNATVAGNAGTGDCIILQNDVMNVPRL